MKSIKLIYKAIAALLLAFVLPVIILGFIAHISMSTISRKAIGESVHSLTDSEKAKLQESTRSKAFEINQFFSGYYRDVELLKDYYDFVENNYGFFNFGQIKDLYPDKPHAGLPGYGYINPQFGAYADFERRGSGSPWLPKRTVKKLRIDSGFRSYVTKTLNKVMFMDHIFSEIHKKRSETLDLVWIVTDIGASNAFPPYDYYDVIDRNQSIVDKNESDEDYVRLLNPENDPERKTLWLEPYLDLFKGIWMTSCVAPLYRGAEFIGTVGMDILLTTITEKVINMKIGRDGYAFLITASGKVVAIPENKINEIIRNETLRKALHKTYLAPNDQHWQEDEVEALSTRSLDQTPNDDLRKIVRAMMSGATGTERITLAAEEKLISYAPIRNTGWSLGLVVPMKELLAPSNYIGMAIDRVSRDIMLKFLISAIVLLIICVIVGAGLHYQIVKPLTRFTSELGRIRWENLEFDGESYARNDEIGQMYSKFREMISILRNARDEITDKSRALKGANEELAKAKAELEVWAGELEKKVEERTEELKKTEESLVRSEKLAVLGQLSGSVSHELRNPLAIMKNAVKYLATCNQPVDAGTLHKYLEIIRIQVDTANKIISDVLEFSKPSTLHMNPARVRDAIETALAEMDVPDRIGIIKEIEFDDEFRFDPLKIKQALSNVITNSVQAIKENGTVKISVKKIDSAVRIVVEDDGAGIDEKDLDRIFEPLFSRKTKGIGFGLTIVRNIIENHGGSIAVESESGKGTRFIMNLPIVQGVVK